MKNNNKRTAESSPKSFTANRNESVIRKRNGGGSRREFPDSPVTSLRKIVTQCKMKRVSVRTFSLSAGTVKWPDDVLYFFCNFKLIYIAQVEHFI